MKIKVVELTSFSTFSIPEFGLFGLSRPLHKIGEVVNHSRLVRSRLVHEDFRFRSVYRVVKSFRWDVDIVIDSFFLNSIFTKMWNFRLQIVVLELLSGIVSNSADNLFCRDINYRPLWFGHIVVRKWVTCLQYKITILDFQMQMI